MTDSTLCPDDRQTAAPGFANGESDVTARRKCTRCKQDVDAILGRSITSAGQVFVGWFCGDCGSSVLSKAGGLWIDHDTLRENSIDPSTLPVLSDQSGTTRCQVCHSRGAQLHHWAPKGIFKADAERWPMDYLCQRCHDLWHQRVTPQLRNGRHT